MPDTRGKDPTDGKFASPKDVLQQYLPEGKEGVSIYLYAFLDVLFKL